jgi:hypothetical protein
MFYRIKDEQVYDFADYKYSENCLHTDLCTMAEFEKNSDNYTIKNGELEVIPNLDDILAKRRQEQFEKDFFSTSLGFIRRKVNMKDGSTRDFLSDLLIPIKAGIELGQNVEIITYELPDFHQELTQDYMVSLQERKTAAPDFIQECLMQTVSDFGI